MLKVRPGLSDQTITMADRDGVREFTRIPLRRQVDVDAASVRVRGAAIRDLSLKGVYVLAVAGLAPGTECVVRLSLGEPPEAHQIELQGRIARCDVAGFGVEFVAIPVDSHQHLRNLILYNARDPSLHEREFSEHLGLRPRPS